MLSGKRDEVLFVEIERTIAGCGEEVVIRGSLELIKLHKKKLQILAYTFPTFRGILIDSVFI